MADNPFVVKGDEWGFCRKHMTRCNYAWTDGSCMRGNCTEYPEDENKQNTDKEENHESDI